MSEVRIVTDSTAFLPKERLEEYQIEVVPLYINFPDEIIIDGKIKNKDFFEKMKKAAKLPFTSQPSPGDFFQVYERIINKGDEIVSIHISSGISGTVGSAATAMKMLGTNRISVVDSLITSGGLAMLVIAAAKAAKEGKTRDEIAAMLEVLKKKIRTLFVPATLEYLKKGGRIGGAQALLGTILQIKPILVFENGKIEVFDKVRTMKRALDRITSELPEKAENIQIAILQAEAGEAVSVLQKLIEERLPGAAVEIYELSPVIGTHAGPGTVGLVLMQQ
jgi:DegV family protein with EDD domain